MSGTINNLYLLGSVRCISISFLTLLSLIFSPAEPCSVSVAATHQLLTNILEHICLTIISDPGYRAVSGAVITETDLKILERCNQENITALEKIVGANKKGCKFVC